MTVPPASPPLGRPARLPSIRRRLLLLQVAVALSWGLAVSLVVWIALAHEVDELLDDTLRASAEVLAALVEPGLASRDTAQAPPTTAGHFAWQLVGPDGRVELRSRRAPEQPFVPLPVTGFADAAEWRIYGQRIQRGEQLLYVAQTREERALNACIGKDRADLVVIGGAILDAVLRVWPAKRIRVADRGLREGVLMRLMARHGAR